MLFLKYIIYKKTVIFLSKNLVSYENESIDKTRKILLFENKKECHIFF